MKRNALIFFTLCLFCLCTALDAHAKPTKPLITFPPRGRVAPVRIPFKKPCMSKNDAIRRFGGFNNIFGRNTLRYNDCDEDGFDSVGQGGTDCSDYDASVNPSATEIPYDGRDNDCVGGDLVDVDGDGFGAVAVEGGTDCDDDNPAINPTAVEVCDNIDNNCVGGIDDGIAAIPADNTQGRCAENIKICVAGDYVDAGTNYTPTAEICDGVDNDCAGGVDNGLTDRPADNTNGECAGNTLQCNGVASWQPKASNYIPTDEICDNKDNNCNDAVDEGVPHIPSINTQGLCSANIRVCSGGTFINLATNYIPTTEMCDGLDNDCANGIDDGLADRPAANTQGACAGNMESCEGSRGWQALVTNYTPTTEICDGIDNDCAGGVDNSLVDRLTTNQNGACSGNKEHCSGASGWQPLPTNYTPIAETCDGLDNDCAGGIDNDLADRLTSNQNGECEGNLEHCEGLAGYQPKITNYIPTAEVCDGLDNNCASGVDEALPLYTWYKDADDDTHGNPDIYVTNCYLAYSTYVSNSDDCNDTDPTINPSVAEDLTRIGDENCDGQGIGNLSEADAVFEGDTASDYTGFSMANVGDMDGDNVPDILVGAPGLRSGEAYGNGEAVLLKGDVADFIDAGAEIYHRGFIDKSWAGAAVASAGDMNDDGVPDIIIGASDTNNFTGAAYLIYGPYTDDIGLSEADYTFAGVTTNNRAGDVVGSAGDFNCDGYGDLLIGAGANDSGALNAGEVYVVFGPLATGSMNLNSANVKIRATEAWSLFGYSAVSADLDHDGCSDLVIGAMMAGPTDNGKVYVFKGSESPASLITTASADAVFTGGTYGEWAGSGLAIKEDGDLTGDGNVDLVIGSQYNSCNDEWSGAVYIVSDPLTSKTLSTSEAAFICGDGSFDQLGDYSSSLDIGDLDGDGVYDLVIGNESNGDAPGKAFLFMGPVGGVMNASDADQVLIGEISYGGYAGRSSIFIDDINGDGILEVGVGDPYYGTGSEGRAYIINGSLLFP
ncbi:MAG: FG-GAP repeat protein [Deltaproteobacteria bacterium]|nr:FG-GAP repeat protein [Deltaproteobacteria bacterium]